MDNARLKKRKANMHDTVLRLKSSKNKKALPDIFKYQCKGFCFGASFDYFSVVFCVQLHSLLPIFITHYCHQSISLLLKCLPCNATLNCLFSHAAFVVPSIICQISLVTAVVLQRLGMFTIFMRSTSFVLHFKLTSHERLGDSQGLTRLLFP